MTRISSASTRFYKYVFPVIWFGALIGIVVASVANGTIAITPGKVLVPCFMAIVGAFVFKRLIWDLADEVQDGGGFLLVKYRGYQERVPLTNIMNVSTSTSMNMPRITLRLITPGPFGSEFAFSPIKPFSLNPLSKSPIAEDLMARVHNARSHRAP